MLYADGMHADEKLAWLLDGDVSIQYQTRRDLMNDEQPELQRRIESEGWGREYLSRQRPDGHWGQKYYQPKWTSTHYTLLDFRTLELSREHPVPRRVISMLTENEKGPDGGINPSPRIPESDVCLNGMFLTFACWFGEPEERLTSIVDFILEQPLHDGGFNCDYNRFGAKHSSLHSTLSVLEGIEEYIRSGYTYRADELRQAVSAGREFILMHRLFRSDRTGDIIHKDFLKLSFPPRWRYNILRALDYFRYSGTLWDDRMGDAVDELLKKRRPDGRWNCQAAHPGQVHFTMEKAGNPGRWNTLLALRVMKHYAVG